jgi:hypothetical protein
VGRLAVDAGPPLAAIRESIGQNKIPVCSLREGHIYVLGDDVVARIAGLDVEMMARERQLPVGQAGGKVIVGIPKQ